MTPMRKDGARKRGSGEDLRESVARIEAQHTRTLASLERAFYELAKTRQTLRGWRRERHG